LSVFVLDQRKRPVRPCCEERACLLLERGRAVVDRRYPFTIRLKDCVGRHCASCGITDVPPKLDHIPPRSRGGSNQVSKLVAVRIPCHTDRGARPIEEFLTAKPALLARIKAQARSGNADAINAKYCQLLHRADGDCYGRQTALPPRPEQRGFQPRRL
jgi:5-methylcytosine-specific restriction endonuclease McrA